jgi:restriction system protein
MNFYLLAALGIFLVVFYYIFKPSKHKKNIQKASKVLLKIRTIEGQFREAQILTYLRKINPYVFEELLLTVFEEHGYAIKRNKRYSHDGGLDGKIYDKGKLIYVQAKRYKSYINAAHLKAFKVCVEKSNAKSGFFIHTGKTGKELYDNFRNSNISILSGSKLIQFINAVNIEANGKER